MNKTFNTFCTCQGVYHDSVAVNVDFYPGHAETRTDPAEPPTSEICSVILEDQGCILDEMWDKEVDELGERMLMEADEAAEDAYDAAADHAYEQLKDKRMGL